MISLNMGIEAALNGGFPTPAAGAGAVGSGAASNSGAVLRVDRGAAGGSASFREALRTARAENMADGAAAGPAQREQAAAICHPAGEVNEADLLAADVPPVEAKSNEAPVETQALGCPGSIGMPWIGCVPAGAPTEMPASSPAGDGTEINAGEDGIAKEGSETLEALSRQPPPATGGSADAAALVRLVGERIELYRMSSDKGSASRLAEIITDLRQPPDEVFPEAAAPIAAAEQGGTIADTQQGQIPDEGRALSGPSGANELAGRRALETIEILPALRRLSAPMREAAAAQPTGQLANATDASSAPSRTVAGVSLMSSAADMTTAYASALRATRPEEITHSNHAAESFRQSETVSDNGGQVLEGRQGSSAESGDFRQAANDFLFSKMPAAGKAVPAEGEALPEGLAGMMRDARAASGADAILEKSGDSPSVSHDKETVAGGGRVGVFEQIVQRAAVHLKHDQGEINIDLKPDFLGRVRMQITTENQQVTVRILTELATVRDMIEIGLPQLKSELQSQGLQVERLEVAVADDPRQRDWQKAQTAQSWKAAAAGEVSAGDRLLNEERSEPIYYRPRSGGTATIDMFV